MSVIDPDSPCETTICGCCGQLLELGGEDCSGVFIGYLIDGCAFEDRRERDCAIGAGRAFDAWKTWVWNACLGPEPDLLAIVRAQDVLPQHEDDALAECEESIGWFSHPNAIRHRAMLAALN